MAIEYITRQDVTDLIDEIEYPRNDDNSINEVRIEKLMSFPRREIEPYLAEAGYKVPVELQTDIDRLEYITVPIFKYYMTNNNGNRTEEIIEGYNNAKSVLNKIANGKVTIKGLPLDEDNTSNSGLSFSYLDI